MLLVTLVEHLVCFMFRLHKFNRGRSVLTSLHSSKTILLLRKYLAFISYFFDSFILVQIQKLSEGSLYFTLRKKSQPSILVKDRPPHRTPKLAIFCDIMFGFY